VIELINTKGRIKYFRKEVAEKELRLSDERKSRGQDYWSLSEDSNYKFFKGALVVKKKKVD